jgi:hypothetical protein
MMRVDPQQRPRLITIIRNLGDRIAEARLNGWLGEVEGLQTSLDAARTKLVALDRANPPGEPESPTSAYRSSAVAEYEHGGGHHACGEGAVIAVYRTPSEPVSVPVALQRCRGSFQRGRPG